VNGPDASSAGLDAGAADCARKRLLADVDRATPVRNAVLTAWRRVIIDFRGLAVKSGSKSTPARVVRRANFFCGVGLGAGWGGLRPLSRS